MPQGGLGGGAPQPPEATVVNICSLQVYRFCMSWLRPPEATEGLMVCIPFSDVTSKGLGTRQEDSTGGSGGRCPPAAGGHGSERPSLRGLRFLGV